LLTSTAFFLHKSSRAIYKGRKDPPGSAWLIGGESCFASTDRASGAGERRKENGGRGEREGTEREREI
jgi:hypothetical protein